MPIIKTLSAAGWEPLTQATVEGPQSVRVERFRPAEGIVYFTVYNDGPGAVDCALEIDVAALGAKGVAAMAHLVSGDTLPAGARLELHLGSEQLQVLRLALAL